MLPTTVQLAAVGHSGSMPSISCTSWLHPCGAPDVHRRSSCSGVLPCCCHRRLPGQWVLEEKSGRPRFAGQPEGGLRDTGAGYFLLMKVRHTCNVCRVSWRSMPFQRGMHRPACSLQASSHCACDSRPCAVGSLWFMPRFPRLEHPSLATPFAPRASSCTLAPHSAASPN